MTKEWTTTDDTENTDEDRNQEADRKFFSLCQPLLFFLSVPIRAHP